MMFRVSVGRQDHPGNTRLPRERADGGLGQQVDTEVTLSGENGDHGGENGDHGGENGGHGGENGDHGGENDQTPQREDESRLQRQRWKQPSNPRIGEHAWGEKSAT